MKSWEKAFVVGIWSHQLEMDTWQGKEGDWVDSWTVLKNEGNGYIGGPVTKRFYSRRIDACRGAAQIFNAIERKLLG